MQIQFSDFLQEYREYLKENYSSKTYQRQIVHDTFCYAALLRSNNYLLSCWDTFGMDSLYLDLFDYLKGQGIEDSEKRAQLFRLSIEKLSQFLHSKYENYRDIPTIEIPKNFDEYIRRLDTKPIDYGSYLGKLLDNNSCLSHLVEIIKKAPRIERNEWKTLVRNAQKGDKHALNRLFGAYMDRILKQAIQFSERYHVELDDCIQEALFGFYEAITKYSINNEQSFPRYYQLWIQKNLLRNSSIGNTLLRYPYHVKEKLYIIIDRINKADPNFFDEYCWDEILIAEISKKDEKEESIEKYVKLLLPTIPLDILANVEVTNCNRLNELLTFDEEPFVGLADQDTFQLVNDAIDKLKEKEAKVIRMRYGFYGRVMTLEEIAQVYGVTRERIRQIEAKAIKKLKYNKQLSCLKS